MATGNGPSLGSALSAAFRAAGATRGGPAKGWHAQLSALTRTKAGQERLLAAGIEPGRRAENWRAWLSESRTPRPATRALIEQAYRGGLPPSVKTATVQISGPIVTDRNGVPRDRGYSEAPLRIDHSNGRWDRIDDAWQKGASDAEILDYYVSDVIELDTGIPEEYFDAPGGSYSVSL